jgi:hypothetical protein
MRFSLLLPLAAPLAVACKPAPPPAPEGLDESTSYMIREFYNDDAYFQAGVQGFMNWYFEEGYLLVGVSATEENNDSFTISDLSEDDIAGFPLQEVEGGRDLRCAKGVVSLAEMSCTWQKSEEYLARTDQDTVFPDNWEGYARTYRTDRDAYEGATVSGEYEAIGEAIENPFEDGFDGAAIDSTIMFTTNIVDPAPVLGVDVPEYEMYLDFRHGLYEITNQDGEPESVSAFAILTFITDDAYGATGENGIKQSYSIEINVQRPDDKTLRMFAAWAEPVSAILGTCEADDPEWEPSALVLNYAVNTSLGASQRLSDVCAGVETIPAEP